MPSDTIHFGYVYVNLFVLFLTPNYQYSLFPSFCIFFLFYYYSKGSVSHKFTVKLYICKYFCHIYHTPNPSIFPFFFSFFLYFFSSLFTSFCFPHKCSAALQLSLIHVKYSSFTPHCLYSIKSIR